MKNSAAYFIFICLISSTLILTGCSGSNLTVISEIPNQPPIQIQDGLDRLINLPKPAERVVSLSPANTEIMFFVGAGSQLVGRETFSDYPEEAKSITDMGDGMGGVNLEAILAVKPDLVLVGDLTPPEQVKSLEDVGLTVFVVPNPKDFSELFGIIHVVARLTGHESSVDLLIENMEARLNSVRMILDQMEERPLVFYEIDGTDPNAPWTAGPGSFIDMMITEAGGRNLGASLSSEWAQISIEEFNHSGSRFNSSWRHSLGWCHT